MSPDVEQALIDAHLKICRNLRSAPNSPPRRRGFECGDGWHGLLESMIELIELPYSQAKLHYDLLAAERAAPTGQFPTVVLAAEEERARRKMLLAEKTLPTFKLVKEKNGILHIEIEPESPRTTALVEFAGYHSRRVCEMCGAPGKLRDKGEWLATRCETHASGD